MNYTLFATIFTLGVIFVNGWTDAPNAITGCVCSGALSMKKAVTLAAVCNFLGIVISVNLFPSVAKNIFETASIEDSRELMAALLSVIVLAVGAWFFGIPTSESHAIIGAIAGVAASTGKSISFKLVSLTVSGLILSVGGGFIAGYFIYRKLKKVEFSKNNSKRLQTASAGAMAFMHGAQDGQKFLGIYLLTLGRSGFKATTTEMLICAVVMAIGTLTGGKRIIDKVGKEMVTTDSTLAISADIAGGISLFLSSILGMPVSTTHAKTASVMGSGYANDCLNKKTMRQMIVAWLITFPVCFGLGWLFVNMF